MIFVEAKENDGWTALMFAAQGGHAAAIAALLAAGAEVEAKRNDDGRTALMRAAEGGHAAAIEALVAEGAEVQARDDKGKTALEIAELCKHEHAARLLRRDAM